ncbi:Y-family DNA polymerase [Neptunomonas sp.]|uniref:Y-family DNA polymerase n=1 Tax=Neptunomonas sp. TaxID=1971898 RepID=UPI0035653063
MYALCDVNSMYASCEKVFDPSIRNKPVVVLTNNDGCICAACHIAKRMGVGKKFVPYFQVKDQLAAVGAVIRSSNYELYADLSQRMMETCERFAPHIHIYSIDECFLYYGAGSQLDYVPAEGWQAHAAAIRRTVWKEVRLPIGVGVGLTPTLAKAANHAAKKIEGYRGVAVIDNEQARRQILKQMAVGDVWGIGRRLSARLCDIGIHTAWDLSRARPALMKKQFSVLVENTVHELNGSVRLSWDDVRAPKQQIYSTRSFGQRITDKESLRHALVTHSGIAAQKLRRQSGLASAMMVFASSSPHDQEAYYRGSVLHRFTTPTSDSRVMANAIASVINKIHKEGVRFYRCGIGLVDLVSTKNYQGDLFNTSKDNAELMKCLDVINAKYGRNTVHLAGQGIEQKFAMKRAFLSPQYTTRLSDLPVFECD